MTDKEVKAYHDKVIDDIKKFGYHMTFVFSDKSPSYCYSTGIYKTFNIPEVFVSSLPQNLSYSLVKSYVEKFGETKTIPLNVKIENLSDRFPIYLIEAQKSKLVNHVLSSIRFYKDEEYRYLQIIYPDTQGHFPNETGYDYDQELMGELDW